MRLSSLVAILVASACGGARPAPRASDPPVVVRVAPSPPLDPVVAEAELRRVLGGDPRPVLAARLALHATGDATLARVVTPATASPEDLALVGRFFPAIAATDELRCESATHRCHLTIAPRAEFPRELSYELDGSNPPLVTAAWIQIINGP